MSWRIFFLVLHIILAVSVSSAQSKRSDREVAGLVGAVRTVESRSVDYTGDKVVGEGFMKTEGDRVTYDEAGREIERRQVSDFGEAMGTITRSFDKSGLLTEDRWLDPKGKLLRRNVYHYANDRLTETLTYDEAGRLIEKTLNKYDLRGRLKEEVYFDPITIRARTVFKYDAKDNLIETAFFLANGKRAIAPVGPCVGAHRVTSRYHESGRIIGQSVFEDSGTEKRSYKWIYNDEGRVVSYISESSGSTVTFVYKYEFDATGNWITRIATGMSLEKGLTVFGDQPTPYFRTTVETRKIRYF
ncbi:MAG: hypothetical protein AB7J13_13755 [Pyrinomonadaceae bacterium]